MKKKMSLFLAVTCVLALAMTALVGCGEEPSSEPAASGDATEFIVGFDSSYPPYGFVGDDGEYTGFDLDLAKEVCDRNGWEFKAEPIDWDAKDALLNQGSISCVWNGFTMEGREGKYTFTKPYMLNKQVIVVKADSGMKDFADLADKYVITQVDSAALDVLETPNADGGQADLTATFKELSTIGEYNTAFLQLDSGQVDAVACDLSIAQYQMSRAEGKFYMFEEALSSENYAVGCALGNDELANTITVTLEEMYKDGTVKEICEKYADYGLSYENWVLK